MNNMPVVPKSGRARTVGILLLILLFVLGIIMTLVYFLPLRPYTVEWHGTWAPITREQLNVIADALRNFKAKTGAYPTNDEGLAVLPEFKPPSPTENTESRETATEPGPGPWPSAIGPITMSGLAYVYENRNGLPAEKFADSPVEKDKEGQYSLEVNDGIYVYSIEEGDMAPEERLNPGFLIAVSIVCVVFIAAIFSYALPAIRRSRLGFVIVAKWLVRSAAFLLLAVYAFFALNGYPGSTTCYVPMRLDRTKRPRYSAEYRQILQKYKDRGIIKETTYNTIMETLKKEQEMLDKESGIKE
jgi:hypothetical protein